MSNRVTRAMAEGAAKQLTEAAYGQKIKDAENERRDVGIMLYEKYIQKEVREAGETYIDVYDSTCYLKFLPEGGSSYDKIEISYYQVNGNFPRVKPIILEKEDWKTLRKVEDSLKRLKDERSQYNDEVEQALVNLRTEKNVREQFPEALPYMNFTTCTALAPNIDKLRLKLT